MKNFVQKGRVVTLAMPYDRLSGQGVLVGSVFGVCAFDAVSSADCEVQVEGVFDVTKDTSTFSQGDQVYWDNSAKKCSSTAGSPIGYAVQAQLTGDSTVRVSLGRPSASRIAATVAAVATADADSTYGAPEETLINELKAQVNAILTALKGAGLMK